MDSALWATLGGVAALLLLLVLLLVVGLLVAAARGRRRTEQALAASRADVDALRTQVEALTGELADQRVAAAAQPAVPPTEFLITTAGTAAASSADQGDLPVVPERAVLSATFGEPLVKAASLAYGLRRALSAESRNRIAFEMRREVKRARKQRRREARRAVRVATARDREEEAA